MHASSVAVVCEASSPHVQLFVCNLPYQSSNCFCLQWCTFYITLDTGLQPFQYLSTAGSGSNKIQTHKRFKITLFTRTKCIRTEQSFLFHILVVTSQTCLAHIQLQTVQCSRIYSDEKETSHPWSVHICIQSHLTMAKE